MNRITSYSCWYSFPVQGFSYTEISTNLYSLVWFWCSTNGITLWEFHRFGVLAGDRKQQEICLHNIIRCCCLSLGSLFIFWRKLHCLTNINLLSHINPLIRNSVIDLQRIHFCLLALQCCESEFIHNRQHSKASIEGRRFLPCIYLKTLFKIFHYTFIQFRIKLLCYFKFIRSTVFSTKTSDISKAKQRAIFLLKPPNF